MSNTNISRNRTKTIGAEIKSGDSRSVLAAMLRKIFIKNGIDWDRFSIYMEDYLNDPRNQIPNTVKARTSERGNLRKELLNSRITWKSFIKGLRFLKIDLAEISLKYQDRYGDEESVTMLLNLDEDMDQVAEKANQLYPVNHKLGMHVIKLFNKEGIILFRYIYDEDWRDIDVDRGQLPLFDSFSVERRYELAKRHDSAHG